MPLQVLPTATGFAAREALALLRKHNIATAPLLLRAGLSEHGLARAAAEDNGSNHKTPPPPPPSPNPSHEPHKSHLPYYPPPPSTPPHTASSFHIAHNLRSLIEEEERHLPSVFYSNVPLPNSSSPACVGDRTVQRFYQLTTIILPFKDTRRVARTFPLEYAAEAMPQ